MKKYNNNKLLWLFACTLLTFASCGDVYDLNGFDWEPDTPPSDSVFNRYIQVLDVGVDYLAEGHKPLDSGDPILFSLEKFSSVHMGYKTSERWDIALGGGGSGNNGSYQGLGYGSSAVGGIVLLDSAYSEVTTVPDDNLFAIPGSSMLDNFMGSGPGHIEYTFMGNPFHMEEVAGQDSNDPEKRLLANYYMHMMYPLSEDLAAAYPGENGYGYVVHPKTLIIRTARGNYAKVEMQSYYKGTIDPKEMSRKLPGNYHSFRYMVIPASEKRFGFVERKSPLTVDFATKTVTVGEMQGTTTNQIN